MKEWFTMYDQYRRTHCVISDLIMGNEYVFRVFAINLVGLSPEPCNSKDSVYIQKTGGLKLNACTWRDTLSFLDFCPVIIVNTFEI